MRKHLHREAEIYGRLPSGHDRLVRMFHFGIEDNEPSIILEYMPNGNLRRFLGSHPAPIYQRLQWIVDAIEAVRLVHDHGVIHADIKPENFLVDEGLRLRLIDFSGSSVDGKPPLVVENTRFFLPRSRNDDSSSVLSDLFALGSSMYEIMTGEQPYAERSEDEVEIMYTNREFPSVNKVMCGNTIQGCWMCRFNSAQEVAAAFQVEIGSVLKLASL